MSLTYTEARDEILTLFRDAWLADAASSSYPLYYWDVAADAPSDPYWARVTLQHTGGSNAALGNRIFERVGLVTVQLFTQFGEGLQIMDSLVKVASDAFEGQYTPGGVWFRNVRLNEIGQDGKWFNANVLADFEYNEVK